MKPLRLSMGLGLGLALLTTTSPAQPVVHPAFTLERILDVPAEMGTWVCLTSDPQGALYASAQRGGLYRIQASGRAPGLRPVEVTALPVSLGMAQGLTWHEGHLYAVVNGPSAEGPGVYRLDRSTTTGEWESTTRILELSPSNPGSEHGPHAIVPGPDGWLYLTAGNFTRPPFSHDRDWPEGVLHPRLHAPTGHARDVGPPGGWIIRFRPDGTGLQAVAAGFRNVYDIAFDQEGDLFAWDSDMERDAGTPWYRPAAIHLVIPGMDYGWRSGSAKWPYYYPDTIPPVLEVGRASPTGLTFAYETSFPDPYREALLAADWTLGRLLAIRLRQHESGYLAEQETLVQGSPLPITDLACNPSDGALYFITGGRQLGSALYRLRARQPSLAPHEPTTDSGAMSQARAFRRKLGTQYLGEESSVDFLSLLGGNLPLIRRSARRLLEREGPWEMPGLEMVQREPVRTLETFLAWSRSGPAESLPSILAILNRMSWTRLSLVSRIQGLRIAQWIVHRHPEPSEGLVHEAFALARRLGSHPDSRIRREVARLAAGLNHPDWPAMGMGWLAEAISQEDQVFQAIHLRWSTRGWNPDLRQRYFDWFSKARSAIQSESWTGGKMLQGYLDQALQDALEAVPPDERESWREVASQTRITISDLPEVGHPGRSYQWQLEDLIPWLKSLTTDRSFQRGRAVFEKAQCHACHAMRGHGGATGPDLTTLASRMSPKEALREILSPSTVISDQFQVEEIRTRDGRTFRGRVLESNQDHLLVATDPLDPSIQTKLPTDSIQSRTASTVSWMPEGLLDMFDATEILDLLAYLLAGADPNHPAFVQSSILSATP